jgi:SAM-dependent methyltransferase
MKTTNAWGHLIPQPDDVARKESMRELLEDLVRRVAASLGVSPVDCDVIVAAALSPSDAEGGRAGYEKSLKRLFRMHGDFRRIRAAIEQRSEIVAGEIQPFLTGTSLLDIGCGNGLIARACADRFKNVLLLDVVSYVDKDNRLPFLKYSEGRALELPRPYDTVLLLTVLHHSLDPIFLLRQAWQFTRRRLIVIESVFGNTDAGPANKYALAGHSIDEQLGYAVYVDWLYNRVLHDDIPVPYNFTTPDRWLDTFQKEGMPIASSVNLGQDIPIAPELHHLFVLER